MMTLLEMPLFVCLNCTEQSENPLPHAGQVLCPGCGAVLMDRLPDEEPGDEA